MSPFNVLENFLYGKKILNQQLKPPLLIIGHPRSGTTFLHYLLSLDSQFAYCNIAHCFAPHSYKLTSRLTSFFFRMMLPKRRQMDNLKMSHELPFEEEFAVGNLAEQSMACGYYFPKSMYDYFEKAVLLESSEDSERWKQHWQWFLKKIAWLNQNDQLLLKSPYNIARTKEILELFPKARFIHIYRNPIEVYASSKHLLVTSLPELALQKWDNPMIENFVLRSYPKVMEKYAYSRKEIPKSQLLELQFDNLVTNTLDVLENIYKHFSISMSEDTKLKYEQEISSYVDYQRNTFSLAEEEQRRVESEWGSIIELFSTSYI